MLIAQNIIDNLKNQGTNPDIAQIKLINLLSKTKFNSAFSIKKFLKMMKI